MPYDFTHNVFLCHSAKDEKLVLDLAERLTKDGAKVRLKRTATS